MPKLEIIKPEAMITPEQDLAERKKRILKTAGRVFSEIAISASNLINEEDFELSAERREQLDEELGELSVRAKKVVDGLPETDEADSHGYKMAA
jgi:hypothetical protein